MEFAQIALSFAIPTGIVYDEDSSDFTGAQKSRKNDEEPTTPRSMPLAKRTAAYGSGV
jgi:hypothetical protein